MNLGDKIKQAKREAYDDGVEDRLNLEDAQSQTIEQLKSELNARYAKDIKETWYWLGDGNDHLESLTCPILIQPSDFMAELEKVKEEAYEEATKRAVEMAVFNIPYICKFQNTPARLVGIVIPDEAQQ